MFNRKKINGEMREKKKKNTEKNSSQILARNVSFQVDGKSRSPACTKNVTLFFINFSLEMRNTESALYTENENMSLITML